MPVAIRVLQRQQRPDWDTVRARFLKEARGPDPALPLSLAIERMRTERAFAEVQDPDGTPALVDLLLGATGDPLAAILRTLKRVLR